MLARQHAGRRPPDERGASDALGLALIAPAALALALVLLFVGRGVDARATTQHAAESAAQAAARERTLPAARSAAQRVAGAMLVDHTSCSEPAVAATVEGGRFVPGAIVSVSVSCTATSAGLELLGVTSTSATATAYAVIDTYRGAGG